MNLINNETQVAEKTTEKNVSPDLAALLNEYNTPAEVAADNNTPAKDNNAPQITSEGNNTVHGGNGSNAAINSGWQGNPLYYQTGRKAGQLRPERKGPKVVYNQSNTPASIGGDLITGAMFLALVNLLMPVLIAGIHNLTVKKKADKIKWDDLALKKDQENKLAPIADMVAKRIIITWSPEAILLISMLGLYGLNYAIVRMEKSIENKLK